VGLNPNVALKTWRRMFNMLNFLKNKTFYDIGIDIPAGELAPSGSCSVGVNIYSF
jgi:hypothetical protein